MDSAVKKHLASDSDGLLTYEYIANNINRITDEMPELIAHMITCDPNGQFCVSAARFLNAIDPATHATSIQTLVAAAIDKDRERAYIGYLLPDLWGTDYADNIETLCANDSNFRRIYKRLHPTGI
ncbi:MAG: hypothetical protein K2M94_05160 [Paramuribaculum sp.]|nr:hypothetical protein [Paramuribaculum sp.]